MMFQVFEVSLYWHDGGSIFLGTVAAPTAAAAEEKAFQQYIAENRAQQQGIEDGGSYQLSADALTPDDAAAWRLKHNV